MRYFARRIGFFLATLWAAITLNFVIPRMQPGDPAEVMVQKLAGKDAQLNPAAVEAMRAMLGAPEGSLLEQYVAYLKALARGDFGLSYTYYPYPVTKARTWVTPTRTSVHGTAWPMTSVTGYG